MADRWANFVIGTGLAFMPDQYMALTIAQRESAIEYANKRNR